MGRRVDEVLWEVDEDELVLEFWYDVMFLDVVGVVVDVVDLVVF